MLRTGRSRTSEVSPCLLISCWQVCSLEAQPVELAV
jgi:hypothetical protein